MFFYYYLCTLKTVMTDLIVKPIPVGDNNDTIVRFIKITIEYICFKKV